MMLLSRAQPAIAPAQRRSVHGLGSSAPLPAVRPSLVCRFKDDDVEEKINDEIRKQRAKEQLKTDLKDAKEGLKNAADAVNVSLKQGATPSEMDSQVKVNWWTPAFTRRREVFAGRLAMVGFFMACVWEYSLPGHPNILQQVSGFTGLNPATVFSIIGLTFAYNIGLAFAPWSPTFSEDNLRDAAKRPDGPPNTSVNPLDFQKFFGISTWGFTKKNELFNGRLAMLGFAAAVFQQMSIGGLSGPGPLAQLAYFFNLSPNEGYFGSMGAYLIGFSIFALGFSYFTGRLGTTKGEEDIY